WTALLSYVWLGGKAALPFPYPLRCHRDEQTLHRRPVRFRRDCRRNRLARDEGQASRRLVGAAVLPVAALLVRAVGGDGVEVVPPSPRKVPSREGIPIEFFAHPRSGKNV